MCYSQSPVQDSPRSEVSSAPATCLMCGKPLGRGRYDTCSQKCHGDLMTWAKKLRLAVSQGRCRLVKVEPAVAVVTPVQQVAPLSEAQVIATRWAEDEGLWLKCSCCDKETRHTASKRGKGYRARCNVCKTYVTGPASGTFKAVMKLM